MRERLIWCMLALILTNVVKAQKYYPTISVDSTEVGLMISQLRSDEAEAKLKKDIAAARRRRTSTTVMERQQSQAATVSRMLKSTAEVLIVDSLVVPKNQLLRAYRFSDEVGRLWLESSVLGQQSLAIYETERGNRQYRAVVVGDSLKHTQLVSVDKEDGQLLDPVEIEGLDIDGSANYPFMMTDGMTFYFAAQTDEGLGNYDLYITRYDSDSGRFYKAENLGFPFNSYANDYMLVIDEVMGVGWFASDRYQAPDSVCVYTFVPTAARHTIDYENSDPEQLRQQASLLPLRSTWTEENAEQRAAAMRSLQASSQQGSASKTAEFTLVIDDAHTYTSFSDFRSQQAAALCRQWLEAKKNYSLLVDKLDKLRSEYASANRTRQRSLTQQILQLEQQTEQLETEVHAKEKASRNAELQK